MGKTSGNCGNSYSANHPSGCPYSGNRGSCSSNSRSRSNESRARGCEGEQLNRAAPCRSQIEYSHQTSPACCVKEYAASAYDGGKADVCAENEYSRAASDAACGYVWRGTERSGCPEPCAEEYASCPAELHVHEVQGSVQVAGERCAPHTHRFACVSCEPILLRDGRHAHKLTFRTDSCEGHCHEFSGMTTGEYEICGCHVHYLEGETSRQAGHCHAFRAVTQIENLIED